MEVPDFLGGESGLLGRFGSSQGQELLCRPSAARAGGGDARGSGMTSSTPGLQATVEDSYGAEVAVGTWGCAPLPFVEHSV